MDAKILLCLCPDGGWSNTPRLNRLGAEMKARLLRMFLSRAEPALLALERKQKLVLVGSATHTERVFSIDIRPGSTWVASRARRESWQRHDWHRRRRLLTRSEDGCGYTCGRGFSFGRGAGRGSGAVPGPISCWSQSFVLVRHHAPDPYPFLRPAGRTFWNMGHARWEVVPVVSLQKCRETAP